MGYPHDVQFHRHKRWTKLILDLESDNSDDVGVHISPSNPKSKRLSIKHTVSIRLIVWICNDLQTIQRNVRLPSGKVFLGPDHVNIRFVIRRYEWNWCFILPPALRALWSSEIQVVVAIKSSNSVFLIVYHPVICYIAIKNGPVEIVSCPIN